MEVGTLKDKVLIAENAFSDSEFDRIGRELESLRDKIEPTYLGTDVILYRLVLDSFFPDRTKSFILQAMQTKLYSDPILNQAKQIHDLSFCLVNKNHKFTTAITEMRGDTDYRSHNDTGDGMNWTGIFMSWIWYFNPHPERFTGGELVIEDLDLTVQPRNNRLIMMPAHYQHRINPAVYDQPGYYRTTVNGFLNL